MRTRRKRYRRPTPSCRVGRTVESEENLVKSKDHCERAAGGCCMAKNITKSPQVDRLWYAYQAFAQQQNTINSTGCSSTGKLRAYTVMYHSLRTGLVPPKDANPQITSIATSSCYCYKYFCCAPMIAGGIASSERVLLSTSKGSSTSTIPGTEYISASGCCRLKCDKSSIPIHHAGDVSDAPLMSLVR